MGEYIVGLGDGKLTPYADSDNCGLKAIQRDVEEGSRRWQC